MKKVTFIVAIFVGFSVFSAFRFPEFNSMNNKEVTVVSDYCDGWEEGYCEGWKDVKGQLAICPITPICPIPDIGQDTYKGGYNRGFKAGSRAAQK